MREDPDCRSSSCLSRVPESLLSKDGSLFLAWAASGLPFECEPFRRGAPCRIFKPRASSVSFLGSASPLIASASCSSRVRVRSAWIRVHSSSGCGSGSSAGASRRWRASHDVVHGPPRDLERLHSCVPGSAHARDLRGLLALNVEAIHSLALRRAVGAVSCHGMQTAAALSRAS